MLQWLELAGENCSYASRNGLRVAGLQKDINSSLERNCPCTSRTYGWMRELLIPSV